MNELLPKVKANLILEHTADDTLLKSYITAAVSYAESYQHIPEGYYKENPMPATTEQAVIMLSSHFYESRDGSTGGFFADNTGAAQQVWNTVNLCSAWIGGGRYEFRENERLCRHCRNPSSQGQRGLHPFRG